MWPWDARSVIWTQARRLFWHSKIRGCQAPPPPCASSGPARNGRPSCRGPDSDRSCSALRIPPSQFVAICESVRGRVCRLHAARPFSGVQAACPPPTRVQ